MEKYSVSFGQQSFLSFNDWPIPGFRLWMAVFLIVSSVILVAKSGTSSVDSTSALGLIFSEIILSIPNLKCVELGTEGRECLFWSVLILESQSLNH